MDCRRNAIHSIGIHAFDHRILHGLSLKEVVSLLKYEKNIDVYRDVPPVFLYGTFAKRRVMQIEGENPLTNEKIISTRARVENRIFDWVSEPEGRVHMTLAKYWDNEKHQPSVCEWSRDLPVTHHLDKKL